MRMVSKMAEQTPLYWLLDIEAYDFDIGVLKDADLTGKALIASRQLWSIVRGSEVISVLIGPGVFKGTAEAGNRRANVLEKISALMFNPSDMRCDEPLPVVDIINPEVIDPLGVRKQEEIVTLIRNLVIEKGNILAQDRLVSVRGEIGPPKIAYYEELLKKINVAHVSGVQRARFILGGTNSPLYRPYVEWFNNRKLMRADQCKVLASHMNRFGNFNNEEIMADWMIVEKAGLDESTGIMAFQKEYEKTFDIIYSNSEKFIFK